MKTLFYAVLLLLLCPILSIGQNSADYYQKIVDTTTNEQLKLSSLDSLIFLQKRENSLDLSANYTEEYIDLALSMKEYDLAMEIMIKQFHMINIQMGQPERALKLIELVEPHIEKTDDSYLKGGIYLKKGGGYFNGRSYDKSIEYYSKAIGFYSDNDSIYKADAIFFRGQAHSETGNFINAINDYQLASEYYENLGDKDYTFYTLASKISIYSIMGFVEKAIEEREKLFQKKASMAYKVGLVADYYNQSLSYKKLGNKEKQLEYLMKSLEVSKDNPEGREYTAIYAALSKYYLKNDLKKAKKYLDLSGESLKTNSKTAFNHQQFQIAKAHYFTEIGKLNQAISIYKNSLKEGRASNKSSLILEVQKQLATIYNIQGKHKQAYQYFQKYTKIKDSLFNRTKTNALAYYQTLYETEKKEAEILKQQGAIEALATQNENKRRLIIFGGIGLALTFLIVLLYRKRIHLKKKNELQVRYSQNLLLSQDIERKRISKDLHDSLGQSLLLVKNKISKEDEEAKELLNDAIDEMRSISRTLYPLQLKQLGITSAISSLIEQLDENYPDTYIFGDVDNIDGILSTEHELNLFRIIQECLSNVVKHAKAESAKLELQREQNKIVMTLQDNGIGFDFLSKFKNLKSLGLKTIKERVNYIDGILRVESSPGNGSKFKIEIQTA